MQHTLRGGALAAKERVRMRSAVAANREAEASGRAAYGAVAHPLARDLLSPERRIGRAGELGPRLYASVDGERDGDERCLRGSSTKLGRGLQQILDSLCAQHCFFSSRSARRIRFHSSTALSNLNGVMRRQWWHARSGGLPRSRTDGRPQPAQTRAAFTPASDPAAGKPCACRPRSRRRAARGCRSPSA